MRQSWLSLVVLTAIVGSPGLAACVSTDDAPAPAAPGGGGDDAGGDDGGGTDAGGDDADAGSPLPVGVTSLSIPPVDAELSPLDELAASASILGIGESIHTSGGFIAAKAALVRHLVEKQGYRVLTFESPRAPIASTMAPYVATCAGNPTAAAQSLFAIWRTGATRDLMSWLCEYNKAHASDPVRVMGFDIQQPEADSAALFSFLTKAGTATSLAEGLATCSAIYDATKPYSDGDHQACIAGLDALDAYVTAHDADLTSSLGADAVADAKLASVSYRAWQEEAYQYSRSFELSNAVRDAGMAFVFKTLRARFFPDQKSIIWAHNTHLSEAHTEVQAGWLAGVKTMGTILRADLGQTYRSVGFVGYDVQINWPGWGQGKVAAPSPNAYEVLLHGLGYPSLFVRLDRVDGALDPSVPRPIGTPSEETMAPAHQWDALLYLDVSLGMTPL
jgi:erythromycin esterase-like protein